MSRLHTLENGYTTQAGRTRQAVMVVMTPEERIKLYGYCQDIELLKQSLQLDGMLPDWNDHDEQVIPGVAQNVGPLHRGGRNKDITEKQLMKTCRALLKIKAALARMDKQLPWCEALTPDNVADPEPQLSRQEVKRMCDLQRSAGAEQEYLRQNPDLIKDKLQNHKTVWPRFKSKK
jgi:hypothetical protein|tara:strand:- start:821 stop:1348 length:528 start_codon:yes stop_codon:yes gene_type:complete